MIKNYCTTVLLIWFQGGFDALLYSFNFTTDQQILHICCYYISPHGGGILNVTVKHYIKYCLRLGPFLLYPVIYLPP